jgi:hypothetical protein
MKIAVRMQGLGGRLGRDLPRKVADAVRARARPQRPRVRDERLSENEEG